MGFFCMKKWFLPLGRVFCIAFMPPSLSTPAKACSAWPTYNQPRAAPKTPFTSPTHPGPWAMMLGLHSVDIPARPPSAGNRLARQPGKVAVELLVSSRWEPARTAAACLPGTAACLHHWLPAWHCWPRCCLHHCLHHCPHFCLHHRLHCCPLTCLLACIAACSPTNDLHCFLPARNTACAAACTAACLLCCPHGCLHHCPPTVLPALLPAYTTACLPAWLPPPQSPPLPTCLHHSQHHSRNHCPPACLTAPTASHAAACTTAHIALREAESQPGSMSLPSAAACCRAWDSGKEKVPSWYSRWKSTRKIEWTITKIPPFFSLSSMSLHPNRSKNCRWSCSPGCNYRSSHRLQCWV